VGRAPHRYGFAAPAFRAAADVRPGRRLYGVERRMEHTMHPNILVAYATKHGSTKEVAEVVAQVLCQHGASVIVRPATEVDELDGVDAVVVGGALYTGRWHRDARDLLSRLRRRLDGRPLAVFGMGPRTSSPADLAEARTQLDHALARYPDLHPVAVGVFGGVIDPTHLRFPFSRMAACDARDWQQIHRWAAELEPALAAARAVAS
jgi:menaquinone-dependent protoporphyrinogen oxidase